MTVSALQRRMERRMVDRCRITADPEGTDDDALNQTTGVLTPPAGDTATVYAGPCLVYYRQTAPQVVTEGSAASTVQDYVAAIPLAEAGPEVGNNFVVTTTSDPRLVNRAFRIVEVMVGSYAVTRDLKLEEWARP